MISFMNSQRNKIFNMILKSMKTLLNMPKRRPNPIIALKSKSLPN
jgi:hypothetical protein